MRLVPALLATTTALAVTPRVSEACSVPACWPGEITPNEATPVPANLPSIYWRPLASNIGGDTSDPTKVVLATAAAPDTPLPITITALSEGGYAIVPTDPLVENTTYVVTDGNVCDAGVQYGPSATIQVGAAAPLPSTLGSLSIVGNTVDMFDVATVSGSCQSQILGHRIDISPNLIAEATPWTSVFHFETYVDGVLWERTSTLNAQASSRGTWEVYRTCDSQDPGASTGLTAGTHTVTVKATIPGSNVAIWSEPLTVDMECPADVGGDDGDLGDDTAGCQSGGGSLSPLFILFVLGFMWRCQRDSNPR